MTKDFPAAPGTYPENAVYRIPQVISYQDPAIMAQVNRELLQMAQDFGCAGNGDEDAGHEDGTPLDPLRPQPKDFNFEERVTDLYAKHGFLSLRIETSYDCGLAHPDNGIDGVTYDMTDGKKVELTDWIEPQR